MPRKDVNFRPDFFIKKCRLSLRFLCNPSEKIEKLPGFPGSSIVFFVPVCGSQSFFPLLSLFPLSSPNSPPSFWSGQGEGTPTVAAKIRHFFFSFGRI